MKPAAWFITIASIIQLFGFFYALPGHQDEASWSAHAQFHHVLGFIWLLGLDVMIMALAWGPLQRRDLWAFRMLVISFVIGQGGWFYTVLLVPDGRPPEPWFYLALTMVVIIYAVGLGMGWRAMSKA